MLHTLHWLLTSTAACLLAATSIAAPGDEFLRRPVVYVCDSSLDGIWRLVDFDGDGAMNSPGETKRYYDDVNGDMVLGNPCAMALDSSGVLFVDDSTQEQVIRFEDLNGDGDVNDPGEATAFFDGSNGSNAAGLVLGSSFAMDFDANGRLWLVNADYGAGTSPDCVFWLEDLNGDGDAMDALESGIFYVMPTGGALGDSNPTAIQCGQDGRVYFVENGYTGFQPVGIYALDDINQDGLIDPLLEVTPFYLPPTHPAPGSFYVLEQTNDGHWLLPDLTSGVIWRLKDGNGDGVIVHEWEAEVFWSPTTSQVWGVDCDDQRGIYLAESAHPDRVVRLEDADWNGVIGPGEALNVYSELESNRNIAAPRAIVVGDLWLPGTVICDGGPGSTCPCGNLSTSGRGCSNSTGLGAELAGFGNQQVAADNYLLRAHALPVAQSGVFLQGAGLANLAFRDGLLCVASPTVRLESVTSDSGGTAQSSVSIVQQGGVQPGTIRYYQLWYRDPGGACGSGSNLTNGWSVHWQ